MKHPQHCVLTPAKLFQFIKHKNLPVKNLGKQVTAAMVDDFMDSDDEDPYLQRMRVRVVMCALGLTWLVQSERREAEGKGEMDSSSDDEDFQASSSSKYGTNAAESAVLI